jgi:hypothetical protein
MTAAENIDLEPPPKYTPQPLIRSFNRELKVAPYSFLKSGKFMIWI